MNHPLNIIAVEDNLDDVFLLQQAFKKAGVSSSLQTVSDGVEALAYLKGEGVYNNRDKYPVPDLMLLDLNMPRLNGFEVLEWVRRESPCTRLVIHVLTTSSRAEDVQRAYDLRANSFVIKPTRMDELVAFVTALHQWHRFTALVSRSRI